MLKKALEPLLPRARCCTGTKMGFAVPLDTWFRGSLRDHIGDVVQGPRLAECGLFDAGDAQAHRRRPPVRPARLQLRSLWSLLMFDGFLRQNATPGAVPERLVTRLSGAA